MIPSLLQIPSAVSDSKLHSVLPNNGKGDFQFDRSTGATRINRDGLIEEVGYFSSELVQNGNFSELGNEEVTNGDFSVGGVVNTSSYALGWYSPDSGISISDGKLILQGTTGFSGRAYITNGVNSYTNVLTVGKTYKLQYDIVENDGCTSFKYYSGAGTFINAPSTEVGSYTIYMTNTANSLFLFRNGTNGSTIKLDNVSVKQVDPNDRWVLKPDWGFVNNGVSITNATGGYNDSALYQLITLDTSKTYKVNINVSSISGLIQVYTGSFGAGFSISTAGEKSFTLDLTSLGNRVNIVPNASTSAVITSFSIVEVQGDRPRLSYDITNGVVEDKPHLLLEPSSTNLVTFSEDFSGYTTNNSSISSNVISSPDGSLSASKLIENTATAEHTIQKAVSVTSGNAYSISVFVKKEEISSVQFGFTGSNFASPTRSVFNIENGTITTNVSNTASIEDYGNGWYKLKVTNTTNATGTAMLMLQTIKSGQASYAGDGVSGFYMWGLQWEQQAYCTSYIPTAGTTITRAAESCEKTGLSGSIGNTEGIIFLDVTTPSAIPSSTTFSIGSGTSSEYAQLEIRSDLSINWRYRQGGTDYINANVGSYVAGDRLIIAFQYKNNNSLLYLNGVKISTDSGSIGANSWSQVKFANYAGQGVLSGKVKGVALYTEALSESQLMQLTGVTASSIYSNFVTRTASFTVEALNEVKKVIDNL